MEDEDGGDVVVEVSSRVLYLILWCLQLLSVRRGERVQGRLTDREGLACKS